MTAHTPRTSPTLVLAVEEHAANRHALIELLRSFGFEVAAAGTLAGGRRLLAKGPAVVILDLLLPDGNGIDLLRLVRQEGRNTVVAVISGASDQMLTEAIKLRPYTVFGKPIDLEDFRGWLQGVVEHCRHAANCGGD